MIFKKTAILYMALALLTATLCGCGKPGREKIQGKWVPDRAKTLEKARLEGGQWQRARFEERLETLKVLISPDYLALDAEKHGMGGEYKIVSQRGDKMTIEVDGGGRLEITLLSDREIAVSINKDPNLIFLEKTAEQVDELEMRAAEESRDMINNNRAALQDAKNAYTAAQAYFVDKPGAIVDLGLSKNYGFTPSPMVELSITGDEYNLQIRSRHIYGDTAYEINAAGNIISVRDT